MNPLLTLALLFLAGLSLPPRSHNGPPPLLAKKGGDGGKGDDDEDLTRTAADHGRR
jgi:hypothetical protein